MKKTVTLMLVVLFILAGTPILAMGEEGLKDTLVLPPESAVQTENVPDENISVSPGPSSTPVQSPIIVKEQGKDDFILYDKATDALITVPVREFLYAAVVCEMPLSFEVEALKAQVVACHSFYANKRLSAREKPKAELKGGDFEVDTKNWSIYTTKEQMEKKWGGKYEENFQKIKSIVDPVANEIMQYEGKPIAAHFHAQSGGKTENALNVWGTAYPYLSAVDSPGDALSPGFRSETTFPIEDFKNILERKISGIKLDEDPKKWVGKLTKTPSGTVIMCSLGDRKASGGEMRSFFSLRSAVFDVKLVDDRFVFTVLGHGHGVGMSQYGAQEMAKQGSSYKEILAWYYKAAELSSV